MRRLKEYVLLSVYDKTGLEDLAQFLLDQGYLLLASGGSYNQLLKKGFAVTEISQLTGEPEKFGGRVKTLHHKIYSGLLLRPDSSDDLSQWSEDYRIAGVVCNFYPFQEKTLNAQALSEVIEWIDIGGPCMVRAAAKNFAHTFVLTHPDQYPDFIRSKRSLDSIEDRARLAWSAFELVKQLDEAILEKFSRLGALSASQAPVLQYGENPHQKASFVPRADFPAEFLGSFSFNNIRDAEAAWRFVDAFVENACVVVKHQNPCGASVALKKDLSAHELFLRAWDADRVSRFGGVIAFNHKPSPETLEILVKNFIEIVVLPEEAREIAEILQKQKPRLGVVLTAKRASQAREQIGGQWGTLIQERDQAHSDFELWEQAGQWMAACLKSNSIAIAAKDEKAIFLVGAGPGQPNRVDCLEKLAIPRAKSFLENQTQFQISDLICFSDAFFPFADALEVLSEVGIKKLYQPGGSKADPELIQRAGDLGIEMKMTGRRHFWH